MINMSFGDRLKLLRETKRLTQKEMGEKLGMSGPSYSKYEYGLREPSIETLIDISKHLDCSIDYLLKGDGSNPIVTFGKKISNLRKEMNLSQGDLSERMGMNKSSLAMYEIDQREPNFETLVKFANFFDVTTDYLLGRTDEHGTSIT